VTAIYPQKNACFDDPSDSAAPTASTVCLIVDGKSGMYGLMALIQFSVFKPIYGGIAPVVAPAFWFTMQLAMCAGFLVSYPVNWWLIRIGWKEKM
jgi:hypothetical protein